jgi:hypothetical protein
VWLTPEARERGERADALARDGRASSFTGLDQQAAATNSNTVSRWPNALPESAHPLQLQVRELLDPLGDATSEGSHRRDRPSSLVGVADPDEAHARQGPASQLSRHE